MKQTTNYQLPQWEESDRIMMRDFNDMTAKIDGAIAALPMLQVFTYTGDGQETREIDLGLKPRAVLVFIKGSRTYSFSSTSTSYTGGLALDGSPAETNEHNGATYHIVEITENGFRVMRKDADARVYVSSNIDGSVYHYIAIV